MVGQKVGHFNAGSVSGGSRVGQKGGHFNAGSVSDGSEGGSVQGGSVQWCVRRLVISRVGQFSGG